MTRLVLLSLIAAFAGDCRCGGEDKEKGAGAQAFRERYLQTLAARAGACTHADVEAVGQMMSVHPAGSFDVGKSVGQGRLTYDAANADPCLNYLRTAPCSVVFSILDERGQAQTACSAALGGAVKSGGECTASMECGVGSFCDATEMRCPGVCKPVIPVGSACVDGDTCADGSDCRCSDGACASKVCKAYLGKGARCDTTDAPSCDTGLYCVPKGAHGAGHCAAQDITDPCPTSAACLPPARCIGLRDVERPGRCSLPKKLGEKCTDGALECVDFATCLQGVCTTWNKVGGTCGNVPGGKEQTQCIGGWCDLSAGTGAGTCKPFRKMDDGCFGNGFLDFECGAGRCDRLLHQCVMPCSAR